MAPCSLLQPCPLLKNKYSCHLSKTARHFIPDGRYSCRDHCTGILPWRRKIGLNSEYGVDKREFLAKGQGRGQRLGNY